MQLLIFCLIYVLAKEIECQTCPTPQATQNSCLIQCNGNENCPTAMLCCTEGCSRMCRIPVQEAPDPAPLSQKCCINGCGQICLDTPPPPPPPPPPRTCTDINCGPGTTCRMPRCECPPHAPCAPCPPECVPEEPQVASCQTVRPCTGDLECRIQNMGPPGCTGRGCRIETDCFARSTNCPDVLCPNVCPFGFLVDENGCLSNSCTCNPVEIRTCEIPQILRCGPNEKCEMRPAPCDFPGACFEQPQCVDVCRDHPCPRGTRCRAKKVHCVTSPCYPVAECEPDVPPTECIPVICRLDCPLYKKDKNNCQICECDLETPPCPLCLCLVAPIQRDTVDRDENGCPICDCGPTPSCQDIQCSPDQRCELRRTPCLPGPLPCYPRPVCRDINSGTCPTPIGIGDCAERCTGDDSCPGSQKCCSNGCGRSCQQPERQQQGTCPRPSLRRECAQVKFISCRGDSECPEPGQRCCFNGCGNTCMNTATTRPPRTCADIQCNPNQRCMLLPTPCALGQNPCFPRPICRDIRPVIKRGNCPRPTGIGLCVEMCTGDDSCPGSQKCCSNGCGRSCQKPERQQQGICPQHRVDPEVCTRIIFIPCRGDSECREPGQRCCFNGCGNTCMDTATTRPPRTCANMQCPPNQRCELVLCPAGQNPCHPRPVCRDTGPVSKPGTCPQPTRSGICVEMCSGDASCPGSQKCCSNGCGHVCQEPEGICPLPNLRSSEECAVVTFMSCRGDTECKRAGEKCCYNGCGYTCIKTSPTPPAPTCANVRCPANRRCELLPTPCAPGQFSCHPQPVCVDVGPVICPKCAPCPPNEVPYMDDVDDNGCVMCRCVPPVPCPACACLPNQVLDINDLDANGCLTCRCLFNCPECAPCPPNEVPYMDDVDDNGCVVCRCVPPVPCPACACLPNQVLDINDLDANGCLTCRCLLPCDLPIDSGPCEAAIPRFAFNQTTRQCESFRFGGCAGNQNNFDSLGSCRGLCERNEPCNLPIDSGPCRAALPRFAFNMATRQCERFRFGGCQGNANNFDSLEQCQDFCEIKDPEPVSPPSGCRICPPCLPGFQTDDSSLDANMCSTCRCTVVRNILGAPCQPINCPVCPPGYENDQTARNSIGCPACACIPQNPGQ